MPELMARSNAAVEALQDTFKRLQYERTALVSNVAENRETLKWHEELLLNHDCKMREVAEAINTLGVAADG